MLQRASGVLSACRQTLSELAEALNEITGDCEAAGEALENVAEEVYAVESSFDTWLRQHEIYAQVQRQAAGALITARQRLDAIMRERTRRTVARRAS